MPSKYIRKLTEVDKSAFLAKVTQSFQNQGRDLINQLKVNEKAAFFDLMQERAELTLEMLLVHEDEREELRKEIQFVDASIECLKSAVASRAYSAFMGVLKDVFEAAIKGAIAAL